VLWRKFGPKKDEVTSGWRKLHNEELRDLYSSPSANRMINQGGCNWQGGRTNGGEERLWIIGVKARRKETTRKAKTYVGG
jgi:hypothetical protein